MADSHQAAPVHLDDCWQDYLRDIGPDPRARVRVRGAIDRGLARPDRARESAPPSSRAAAAVLLFKSASISVGIALATLGGLHVAGRAWSPAPAELPVVSAVESPAPRAPVVAAATPEPVAAITPTASPAPLPAPSPDAHVVERRRDPVIVPSAPPAADDLRAEIELMDRASAALAKHDDVTALNLIAEHARRFPRGGMLEERSGFTVIAKCHRGDAKALAASQQFTRDYPSSPLLDDVRHACAKLSSTDSKPASE